jgi:hypothetical protein
MRSELTMLQLESELAFELPTRPLLRRARGHSSHHHSSRDPLDRQMNRFFNNVFDPHATITNNSQQGVQIAGNNNHAVQTQVVGNVTVINTANTVQK